MEKSKQFVKVPMVLFTDDQYNWMKPIDILVYSVMVDRKSLSKANKWVDENGEVYIKWKMAELAKFLNTTKPTIDASIKRIEQSHLLHVKRFEDRNKANLYYVHELLEHKPAQVTFNVEDLSKEILPSNDTLSKETCHLGKETLHLSKETLPESYLLNHTYLKHIKDYVLSYIERHNFEIDDTLKEKIANNYKGAIMSVEEKNERLNSMIDTYIKNEEKLELGDTSELAKNKRKKGVTRKGTGHSGSIGSKKKTTRKEITPDWFEEHREESEQPADPKEATQEEIERLAVILAKQKEEPQAPNPTLEPKKELIQTVTGYQEAIVMPDNAENPFLEASERKEDDYTTKEEKPYINENETSEDYNNMNIPPTYIDYAQLDSMAPPEVKGNTKTETPKLTGNQLFRISKLTKKANSGDVEAWRKCESLEMKRFVEIGERGRFKVKDDILTAM